jgi:hypothetical protein
VTDGLGCMRSCLIHVAALESYITISIDLVDNTPCPLMRQECDCGTGWRGRPQVKQAQSTRSGAAVPVLRQCESASGSSGGRPRLVQLPSRRSGYLVVALSGMSCPEGAGRGFSGGCFWLARSDSDVRARITRGVRYPTGVPSGRVTTSKSALLSAAAAMTAGTRDDIITAGRNRLEYPDRHIPNLRVTGEFDPIRNVGEETLSPRGEQIRFVGGVPVQVHPRVLSHVPGAARKPR